MARKVIVSYTDIGIDRDGLVAVKKHWLGDSGDKFEEPSAVKAPAEHVVRIASVGYEFDMDDGGDAIGRALDKADGDMERELVKQLTRMRSAVDKLLDDETQVLLDTVYGKEESSL
jgi:hypothetical protein